ncbi:DNA polymerase III subunit beta [Aliifodinibius sp. S!AR15-10]|uniref:DNA polymerase III subunit beta n=1 Tax=Aliifodinibius sp. S!AR15-10 TaxID=2950437 RepID=UPI00285D18F8|nr:DNA polymerase III subunit beta [Aliifodinibius sp. S!AR15-10]MDR8392989.1 DNA polymerase III subunit beta [Aliifodinibius sp. S!AR15-10]
MKFNASSSDLVKALSAVSGAVPNKATLPILETILFESEDGKLRLTATDLEISIIEYMEADIDVDGAVAIPARRLIDTLRQLPDIPVSFDVDEKFNIKFRTDKGTYKLVGEDPDEFPEVPDLDSGQKLETTKELILDSIDKTLFAVSNDDLRPAMMGVYFDIGPEETKFVATDGHRLVRFVKSELTSDQEVNFIVPEKALSLVQKALHGEECELTVTEDHARFKSGNTIVITRLINEQYPNYESVIPRENDKKLVINKEQMLATVKRVSIFSSSTTRQIRLQLDKDKLTIRAEDIDMSSEARETISCEYDEDSMEIGFNAKYLADVLGNVDGEEVYFEFSTPNRAGIVKPLEEEEDEEMLMLVMPVMLNSYA